MNSLPDNLRTNQVLAGFANSKPWGEIEYRGFAMTSAVLVAIWAAVKLVKGVQRTNRSGDRQYRRRGFGAVHVAAAALCLLARPFVESGWYPWLNAACAALVVVAIGLAMDIRFVRTILLPGLPVADLMDLLCPRFSSEARALGAASLTSMPTDARVLLRMASFAWWSGDLAKARDYDSAINLELLPPKEMEQVLDQRKLLAQGAVPMYPVGRIDKTGAFYLVLSGSLFACTLTIWKSGNSSDTNTAAWIFGVIFCFFLLIPACRFAARTFRRFTPRPSCEPLLLSVIEALKSDKRCSLAITIGDRRLEDRPDDDDTRVALAEVLVQTGDPTRAGSLIENVNEARLSAPSRDMLPRIREALRVGTTPEP